MARSCSVESPSPSSCVSSSSAVNGCQSFGAYGRRRGMGRVLAKCGPGFKLGLASALSCGWKRPSGSRRRRCGTQEGQGGRARRRPAAAEARSGRGGRGRLGAAPRFDPPRRRAGDLRARLRGALAPEDGHPAPGLPRLSPHHGAAPVRRGGAPHRFALAPLRRRPGVRPAAVPARSAPRPRPARGRRQDKVPASAAGRPACTPRRPAPSTGARGGGRRNVTPASARRRRSGRTAYGSSDTRPRTRVGAGSSRARQPPPRASLEVPRGRPESFEGCAELPPQRGDAAARRAPAPFAGTLARRPRSPRGSPARGRVRAEAVRRLRRRLGGPAADEGPRRPDRRGAGSVPRLDAAGSLRRAGCPRLDERAAAVQARAARDQRGERGCIAAAGHRGLARRGGGGFGARIRGGAGGRARVAGATRRGAGAGTRLMRALAAASAAALAASASFAEEKSPVYFPATVAGQAHPAFHASYTGKNSLRPDDESALSVVMDLGARIRPWSGAELVVQPELAGGKGLSSTLGVAAYPSGEVYRIGNPEPTVILARASLRQVAGPVTITLGKFSTPDVFDNNAVSNDPHTRFMSWGLWASAAYDYPADVRGYTWGAAVDYSHAWWSARAGMFLEPLVANGAALERDVTKARGLVAEVEARSERGAVRALAFLNTAHMGSYAQAVARRVDVSATRADGRTKAGAAASGNYDFGGGLGCFARASLNDGQNETLAFTEIDRSLAVGAVQSGARLGRGRDEAGAALVVSGLSAAHRSYLASGADGALLADDHAHIRAPGARLPLPLHPPL